MVYGGQIKRITTSMLFYRNTNDSRSVRESILQLDCGSRSECKRTWHYTRPSLRVIMKQKNVAWRFGNWICTKIIVYGHSEFNNSPGLVAVFVYGAKKKSNVNTFSKYVWNRRCLIIPSESPCIGLIYFRLGKVFLFYVKDGLGVPFHLLYSYHHYILSGCKLSILNI